MSAEMQILVVEDDADIAALIAHYVRKAGWEPQVFASGDAALGPRGPAAAGSCST